jgi:hypothetical protein
LLGSWPGREVALDRVRVARRRKVLGGARGVFGAEEAGQIAMGGERHLAQRAAELAAEIGQAPVAGQRALELRLELEQGVSPRARAAEHGGELDRRADHHGGLHPSGGEPAAKEPGVVAREPLALSEGGDGPGPVGNGLALGRLHRVVDGEEGRVHRVQVLEDPALDQVAALGVDPGREHAPGRPALLPQP